MKQENIDKLVKFKNKLDIKESEKKDLDSYIENILLFIEDLQKNINKKENIEKLSKDITTLIKEEIDVKRNT